MKIYKIRNKKTGKYSTGGKDPKFSSYGKSWSSMGHIRNHYKMVRNYSMNKSIYSNCEVVIFEEKDIMDLVDLMTNEEMIREIID